MKQQEKSNFIDYLKIKRFIRNQQRKGLLDGVALPAKPKMAKPKFESVTTQSRSCVTYRSNKHKAPSSVETNSIWHDSLHEDNLKLLTTQPLVGTRAERPKSVASNQVNRFVSKAFNRCKSVAHSRTRSIN